MSSTEKTGITGCQRIVRQQRRTECVTWSFNVLHFLTLKRTSIKIKHNTIEYQRIGDLDLGLLDDDDYKVSVLRTKLLGIAECFMYRLPKGSSSPYRWVIIQRMMWRKLQMTDLSTRKMDGEFFSDASFFSLFWFSGVSPFVSHSKHSLGSDVSERKHGPWPNHCNVFRYESNVVVMSCC